MFDTCSDRLKKSTISKNNPNAPVINDMTYYNSSLENYNFIDPISEARYSSVDAGLVGKSTSDTPRDDASQLPGVLVLDH